MRRFCRSNSDGNSYSGRRMTQERETSDEEVAHRQQNLYFNELFQLKVRCEYTRQYRDRLAAWVTRFAIVRAIASNGGIAGWVVWKDLAFAWATVIALSQLADALQNVVPFAARQKATNALLFGLDALFIEALFEWESVFSGILSNTEIMERRKKLMQLQHELDGKHFPTGDLPRRPDLLVLAETDAIAYFEDTFRERASQ